MNDAAIARLDLDELRAQLATASGDGLSSPAAGSSGLAAGPSGLAAGTAGPAEAEPVSLLNESLRPLGLRRLVEGDGALAGIADLLAASGGGASRPVIVLAAATPMTVRQTGLRAAIEELTGSRFAVKWVVIGPASGAVHADEQTVAEATAAAAGARCVVTVGSGTITDIGKAAAPAGATLIAVQTAASVNGYADPFSVLLRDGVKRTTPTRWPDVLVIDPAVLLDAPAELNRAGVGDMAAMFTASADWYLASLLGADGPPFRREVAGLVRPHGQRMFALAGGGVGSGDRNGDAGRLAELARLLTLSGIAMGVTGSTAPASGMEHAVSHLLEMAATATGQPGNLHGAQVGVASITAAATWAHVRQRINAGALDRPARLPDPDRITDRIGAALGPIDPTGAMATECLADYTSKLRLLASRPDPLAPLRTGWAQCEAALTELLIDPATLAAGLRSAGLPTRFDELPAPTGATAARWAVANCALQRRRFGVADLAMLIGGWEDDDVDSVLATTAAAAAMGSP